MAGTRIEGDFEEPVMVKREDGDLTVEYDASHKMQGKVFDHILAWFHKHQCYSGESIMQSDAPQLTAAEMLAELADDIIKFNVTYKD